MKVLALLVAAGAIVVVLHFGEQAVREIARRIAARRTARAPWSVIEEPAGGELVLYAARPGRARIRVASVALEAEDFTIKLYEMREVAADRVRALNDHE